MLTNYGRIDLLWFDTDGGPALWDQEGTYALVKKLQPQIIINNRLDYAGKAKATVDRPESIEPDADYYTPEQFVGGFDCQHPWESCMTTSRRGQWLWGGHADGVKSFEAVMAMLIGCSGGDGNVLLNVGPMPNGEIAAEQANLIKQVGRGWPSTARASTALAADRSSRAVTACSTRKGDTIYVHIRKWSGDTLKLPAIAAKVMEVRLLTGGSAKVHQTDAGLEISVPESARQPIDTIVALELDTGVNEIPAVDVPRPVPLSEKAKATASNTYRNDASLGPDKAVDGNGETRWATDAGLHQAWLELDLGRPLTFKQADISEAYPNRVQKFECNGSTARSGRHSATARPSASPGRRVFPPSPPSACG